ncbi:MAG: peptide deformylase [Kangiellaceae bacterium]|jgi:peptide deformylase|nr:peptide deformylase [Kangiellaceae bacterium]
MRIKQLGDPILREISQSVSISDIESGTYQATVDSMKQVLNGIKSISDANGNAISAPQVGHTIRLVVLRIDGQFVVLFNPTFRSLDQTTFMLEEECFSFYQLRAKVERYANIEVNYLDQDGQHQSLVLNGEYAGIAQHEIDHLDGVLFIDRVDDSKTIRSIDFEYAQQPMQLKRVKKLYTYMAGSD